jgi:hypothetical protein
MYDATHVCWVSAARGRARGRGRAARSAAPPPMHACPGRAGADAGALPQQSGCATGTGVGACGQRGAAARLLHLENVLVEVLLQLLVRQVDAELLEVVLLEALEACARQGRGSGPAGPCTAYAQLLPKRLVSLSAAPQLPAWRRPRKLLACALVGRWYRCAPAAPTCSCARAHATSLPNPTLPHPNPIVSGRQGGARRRCPARPPAWARWRPARWTC